MISISPGSTYIRGLSMQLEPGITASDKPSPSAAHCSSRFVGFFNLSVKAIISMGVGKEIAMHPLFKSFVLKEQIIRRTIE